MCVTFRIGLCLCFFVVCSAFRELTILNGGVLPIPLDQQKHYDREERKKVMGRSRTQKQTKQKNHRLSNFSKSKYVSCLLCIVMICSDASTAALWPTQADGT